MKTTAWKQIQNFLSDEEGATAVEYGIMVALIAAAIVVVVTGLGTSLNGIFGDVTTAIETARPTP